MAPKQYKSRIHLLVAKNAPTVVIVQRKRAKLFHIVLVDADKRRIEEGSWFRGKLYALRCDVSFDGKHMVYLAMGSGGNTWNGVCRLPWLATQTEAENMGAWFGGGYFADKKCCAPTAGAGLTSTLQRAAARRSRSNRTAHAMAARIWAWCTSGWRAMASHGWARTGARSATWGRANFRWRVTATTAGAGSPRAATRC